MDKPELLLACGKDFYKEEIEFCQDGVIYKRPNCQGTLYDSYSQLCVAGSIINKETFTDQRDGKEYKIVVIGEQTWMAENLSYNALGSKCYDDDLANCEKYGRLYDWETALNVCPDGWHLPTDAEWTRLRNYVGDDATAKLKTIDGWNWNSWSNISNNGIDHYGFSALPAGFGTPNGDFSGVGGYTSWWNTINGKYHRNDETFFGVRTHSIAYFLQDSFMDKSYFLSVRCLKGKPYNGDNINNNSSSSSNAIYGDDLIDERDPLNPKVYKTVVIGEQTWMATNLNYDTPDSKCFYNNPIYCEKYGRFYNWKTAMTVCPDGWHLPSDEEWAALENFVGSNSGAKLKATSGWAWNDWDNISGNGTDDYGFSALPDGPGGPDGDFSHGGNLTSWWSTTCYSNTCSDIYVWRITYYDANIYRSAIWTSTLMSVRCIKDSSL
ncbi:MAG: hypothetical protein LBU89_11535 [Fibromonadaceae bacterium]|nr:hypothetical protein [Fibromonadaceae bacterium]